MMYVALMGNSAPIRLPQRSYNDFRIRKHGYTSLLTSESPRVRARTAFAANNHGGFPDPLPLGKPYLAAITSVYVRVADGCGAVRLGNVGHG